MNDFNLKAILFLINNETVGLGIGTHLFVKVPRPGYSEGTFSILESSSHLLLSI